MSTVVETVQSQDFVPLSYPAFPPDTKPCVELETFSLAELLADNQTERKRLLETCKSRGFFYLNFTGSGVADLPNRAAQIVTEVGEKFFSLPREEKSKYSYSLAKGTIFGYKEAGLTITDKKGTRDTAEFFNIAKDEMLGTTSKMAWPQPVTSNSSFLARYQRDAHQTGLQIMSILAKQLGLPADVFEDKHTISEESGDHIRITYGPPRKSRDLPEIQTPGHTDFGTITVLFNWLGGLQVWSESSRGNYNLIVDPESKSGSDQWLWVIPKPGMAIVNLGDAAVKMTNGVLCSGRHRVIPAPGVQGLLTRYSLVYFVRPMNRCVLKQIRGGQIPDGADEEEITANDWIMQQANRLLQMPKSDA